MGRARVGALPAARDILTDEEKTQRALCRLLDALLCTAPADAAVGHAELEALPPLLALMRTQRADAELQAVACAREVIHFRLVWSSKQFERSRNLARSTLLDHPIIHMLPVTKLDLT